MRLPLRRAMGRSSLEFGFDDEEIGSSGHEVEGSGTCATLVTGD